MGFTAFGGPSAHIAIMHDETVIRRKWLSDQEFIDLVGATNLIPGPNSTEMAIHLGYRRAGWPGLIAAGVCFILPAMLIVLALAWMYVQAGKTPEAGWLLYGIKPVVIAIIAQAIWTLGRKTIRTWQALLACLAILLLYFLGVNELVLLFGGGLIVMGVMNFKRLRSGVLKAFFLPVAGLGLALQELVPFSLPLMFLTFLKIGAVLYGSGYVLMAFLRSDFVVRYGWLTDQQLMDAISVGQVTPGPVFTTATFIGYLLGSTPGALLATLAIFLPSFIFVALSHPLVPRLRRSQWFGSLLDGVNIASLGLMAGVTVQLGGDALVDPLTILLAVISLVLLVRWRINSTWLILGGAAVGLLSAVLR
jgi:chromate transporter